MTGTDTAAALLRALRHLLPDAILSVTHERPWCSLTFTGTQLCLSAVIVGESHHEVAAEYVQILPDHEFTLGRQLVADIAVSEHVTDMAESCLVIHALLLND
jgi:hypothetical protein